MSSLVFPFHDPNNIETKFIKQILPVLKDNFDNAFVSITPKTLTANPEALSFLQQESFFIVNINSQDSLIGDHFVSGYKSAVSHSENNQILHLCNSDRLAFALLNYKESFLRDLSNIDIKNVPMLFLRSQKAWDTHPKNYYAAESMVTEAGKILFEKTLDFTWCHLSLTSEQLEQSLPILTARDILVTMQLVLSLKDIVNTKEVEWLSWEDPFIFDKDTAQYKLERENDPMELEKRMNYVLPEIRYLFEEYKKVSHS